MTKTVVVTGAAGSIGSEVCRALVREGCDVVGFDQAETPLFWLDKELRDTGRFEPVIGSVRDAGALRRAMRGWGPDAVIHAAALKHVGLSERNVCEAALTNIEGTQLVAEAAAMFGARLVLVSTDKAVYPTTVMGATKAVAEAIASRSGDARIVRLVNIWESAGSLRPVMRAQIEAGGPVTITDPRMIRYFMHGLDAAELLVRQALEESSMPFARLVLPRGPQAKSVLAVAHELMAEMGKVVPIVEIGKLPGEKIVEDLLTEEERDSIDAGYGVHFVAPSWRWRLALRRLLSAARGGQANEARHILFQMVGRH